MNNILITNGVDKLANGVIQKPIIDDWKVTFNPKTVKPGKVLVSGNILGWDYSFKKPKTRITEAYSDEMELNQEQFDIWKSSGFETIVLLLLLVIDKPESDDYEALAWDYPKSAKDWILRAIIPNCCACGSPDTALKSVTRVMSSFKHYPGGVSDVDIYEHGSDLAVAYQIDARSKFLEHGSSIGGSWLTVSGVIWSLAAMMEQQCNARAYEDSLPSPIKDINYLTLKVINDSLAFIGFLNHCIHAIRGGTSTYEELWEEEGGHEESGAMWYIYSRNDSPENSIKALHDDRNHAYRELMGYCGTKTWADTKIVLAKIDTFKQKGLDYVYGE